MSAKLTGADWIGHAAWWLAPLARLVGATVMAQPLLHTDDTPIRTLAPGTGRTRLSRLRVYAVDPRPHAGPGVPAAFYRYSPDRKGERPRDHLAGSTGIMHADLILLGLCGSLGLTRFGGHPEAFARGVPDSQKSSAVFT